MLFNNSMKDAQMFDGPFKIPLPRKAAVSKPSDLTKKVEIKSPKAQYAKVDKNYQNLAYQNLMLKFLQAPEKLSNYESKLLSAHPVIRMLIKSVKESKNNSFKNANFYIPLNCIFNPEMYENSSVPVIFESEHVNSDCTPTAHQNKQNELVDEELSEDSTASNSDLEECNQKKIGFYTLKERKERILKYKKKVMNWKKGDSQLKKSAKKRKYNRLQPRFNGKFVSYNKNSIENSNFTGSKNDPLALSCSQQYLETTNDVQNLNQLVSEITGIF